MVKMQLKIWPARAPIPFGIEDSRGVGTQGALLIEEMYFQLLRPLRDSRIGHRFLDCWKCNPASLFLPGNPHRPRAMVHAAAKSWDTTCYC